MYRHTYIQREEASSHVCVHEELIYLDFTKLQWGTISHWSEWPSLKCLQIISAGEGMEKREPSYTVGENVNWRTVWRFLKKNKHRLPYNPVIPLLGIYPEKSITQKDTCTPMFIAAVFTLAKTWKQSKCPLMDEWVKKMWGCVCVHNEIFSSVQFSCSVMSDSLRPHES